MNILHLSPYVPDVRASHAGGVHMGKTVETLKKNHNVTVLTFCNNEREKKLLEGHPDYEYVETSKIQYVLKALAYFYLPNLFALRKDRRFRKKICEIIEKEKIEAVYAEYTAMGQYTWIKKKYPQVGCFTLVEHDVVAQSYERQYKEASGLKKLYIGFELKKVRKYEKKYVDQADLIITLNEKDSALVHEKYHKEKVKAINPYYGIDFDRERDPAEKEQAVCFVGQMGRDENHTAAMRLIRIFKGMEPSGWKLKIIGANPKPELQAEESEEIHITGFVEDINAEISKCRLAVFPLTVGAGIKLKVLLAFGLGLPVITSAVGAEGIDPDGEVLCLAETDDDFAREMSRLMEDAGLLDKKAKEAEAFVKKRFSWEFTENILNEIHACQ